MRGVLSTGCRAAFPTIPRVDLLTAAEMREADRRAIEEAGIPARDLMENAGRAVAGTVAERAGGRRVLILCGRGGNGGDGLVALRELAARGFDAAAVVLAEPGRLGPETRANHDAAARLALRLHAVPDEAAWESFLAGYGDQPHTIVDAILGVGATGPLRGLAARVVADLDRRQWFAGAVRIAVDLPTGLAADSGALPDLAFRADLTVALGAAKPCHFVFPASAACGEVRVAGIGIPAPWLTAGAGGVRTNDARRTAPLFPPRAPGVHKGDLGRLLLVAGSRRLPGAAALAAHGALRAGVGLLTVAGPEDALRSLPPEAMRLPLPAGPEGEITLDAAFPIREFPADALAVGPGLGSSPETREAVRQIVLSTRAPLVLDADGLNGWAGRAAGLAARPRLALTPHPGEAARLLDRPLAEVVADRLPAARALARLTRGAVALKGPGTLIAEPGGSVLVNRSGGPELATGGAGDVLTGVVGALLARRLDPAAALSGAVFVHGLAGEAARRRCGEDGVTASAVAARIGPAIRRLRRRAT